MLKYALRKPPLHRRRRTVVLDHIFSLEQVGPQRPLNQLTLLGLALCLEWRFARSEACWNRSPGVPHGLYCRNERKQSAREGGLYLSIGVEAGFVRGGGNPASRRHYPPPYSPTPKIYTGVLYT